MRRNLLYVYTLTVLIAAGCSKSKTPGPTDTGSKNPPKLQIVSGNNQSSKVGFYPADTIKVKASGDGFDYTKYYVEFRGSGCNADLPFENSLLADGTSRVGYRLGGAIGAQTLQATLVQIGTYKRIDSVTFSFTGTAPTSGLNYAACTPLGAGTSFSKTGTGRLFAAFDSNGKNDLRYSDDDGISWFPAKGIKAGYTIQKVKSDGKNQVIAYSMEDGLYYSADNGETWKVQSVPFKGILANALTYTPSGKIFFVGFNQSFYYSADNGVNWNTLTLEKGNGLTLPQEGPGGEFYVFVQDRGIFKSTDRGATWKMLPYVTGTSHWDGSFGFYVDYGTGWLYKSSQNPSAIYVSKDGGNTYSLVANTDPIAFYFMKNDGVLYFQGGYDIYKIDGGRVVKIISGGPIVLFDGDFIVSNSGNVIYNGGFLSYIKP